MPGHGEPGTIDDITVMERYLHETLQMVEQNLREGGTLSQIAALQSPAFTEGWQNAESFETNMKFLYEEVQRK
jgi:hypothetical protein